MLTKRSTSKYAKYVDKHIWIKQRRQPSPGGSITSRNKLKAPVSLYSCDVHCDVPYLVLCTFFHLSLLIAVPYD